MAVIQIISRVLAISIGLLVSFVQAVEPPRGFEVVEVTQGDIFHNWARMNNCGEIVFTLGFAFDANTEVVRYDNGLIEPLTNNEVLDDFPDINDVGTIVWTRGSVSAGEGVIIRLEDSAETILGNGTTPNINNHGHVVWKLTEWQTCAYETDVYFFDGQAVIPLTSNGQANQSPRANDHDQVVWARYDFCAEPWWTSQIELFNGDEIVGLVSGSSNPQAPSINNFGMVAWGSDFGVEMSAGESTELLTDWGNVATINDSGHILFIRFHQHIGAWQCWLYRDGRFYRLIDDTNWHVGGDMNNAGECAWTWSSNPNDGPLIPSGLRMLRRVRNGDINFDYAVDLVDHATIPDCLTGPGDFDRLCDCRFADMGHNRNVDLADFALFQNTFAHPQYPGHGCCDLNHGGGCNDESVQDCVCAVLPSCCTDEWTDTCIILVEQLKCGTCP